MNDNTSHPVQAALVKSGVAKAANDLTSKGYCRFAVAFAMLNQAYALFREGGHTPGDTVNFIHTHIDDAELQDIALNG